MRSRNKGALAEYRFISTAISLDLKVLKPAVEGYAYDAVIDNGNRFYKIQVKYASKDKRRKSTFQSMLHRKGASSKVFRPYKEQEVDFFAIYIFYIDTFYLIPFDAVEGISISLNPNNPESKYEIYKHNWKQLLK